MAIFTVNTVSDVVNASDGQLSLREAVAQANATAVADTIVFSTALEGGSLVLTQGELSLSSDITIDGDQNNDGVNVNISAGNSSRFISAAGPQTDIFLFDIAIRDGNSYVGGGYAGAGGAIHSNLANLNISNVEFYSNTTRVYTSVGPIGYTTAAGGAIYTRGGNLTIESSQFTGNSAFNGGAIASSDDIATTLTIRNSVFLQNTASVDGGAIDLNGHLVVEGSRIEDNVTFTLYGYDGENGGISLTGSGVISSSSILANSALYGAGGIAFAGTYLQILNSTIANNSSSNRSSGGGVNISSGELVLRHSTVTGNRAGGYYVGTGGGGISIQEGAALDIANSIVVGNRVRSNYYASAPDILGSISRSNGHNLFGSDVIGNISGDLENITAGVVFALTDAVSGGGRVNVDGVVPLRPNVTNPALGGGDRLLMQSVDQLGISRAAPSESNPDVGSIESGSAVSTTASANNDALTGTAAANTISGLGGHDFIRGLGGNDTLSGNDGGDFLTGGVGNDRLNGGNGIDLVH